MDSRKVHNMNELFWLDALGAARAGYPDRLAARLRDPKAEITPEAREYLAAIVEGSERAPVRDTRRTIDPYTLAKMKVLVARHEEMVAGGYLTPAKARRVKAMLMAEFVDLTGAKPGTVRVRWDQLAAAQRPHAQELAKALKDALQTESPTPQRTIYRSGKAVKLKS